VNIEAGMMECDGGKYRAAAEVHGHIHRHEHEKPGAITRMVLLIKRRSAETCCAQLQKTHDV